MLLNLNYEYMNVKEKKQLQDLTEKYKAKGIIKKYSIGFGSYIYYVYEDFKWI